MAKITNYLCPDHADSLQAAQLALLLFHPLHFGENGPWGKFLIHTSTLVSLGIATLEGILLGWTQTLNQLHRFPPPCFKCDARNIHDDRAMQLCFGPILVAHAEHGVSGVLLLCLASMGHHADFLKDFVVKAAAHPFSQIPILNDSMLLGELKDLLTLDPDGEIQATGIPPHVQQAVQLRHIMELCTE